MILKVIGQTLERTSFEKIVTNSLYFLTVQIDFSPEWNKYTKTIHFLNGYTPYDYLVDENDEVTADKGINLKTGDYDVYITGVKDDSRITTNPIRVHVENTGPMTGTAMDDESLTVLESMQLEIEELKNNGTGGSGSGGSGEDGEDGTTYIPSVDAEGNLSWSNTDGKTNPETVNIKGPAGENGETGPKGDTGETGAAGPSGADGVSITSVTINASNHLICALSNSTTIDAGEITVTSSGSVDLSGYYTASQVDALIQNLITTYGLTEPETEASLTLTYTFANNTKGNGDGIITLLANKDNAVGDYSICWADNSGALADYKPINTMTLTAAKDTNVTYDHLISTNMIPVGATKIIAVKDSTTVASYAIPSSKQITDSDLGTKLTSICLISDSHISSSVDTSAKDTQDVLGTFAGSVDAFIHAGDATDGGTSTHWELFQSAKTNYAGTTPVYVATGNHDNYASAIDITTALTTYTNSPSVYFSQTIGGQIFLFVGLISCTNGALFSTEEKTWLEQQLEAHRNERVFVVIHTPIHNTVGNPNNTYNNYMLKNNDEATKISSLMTHYTNVVMITGHTHFSADEQETSDTCNYYCNNSCKMIHVPSLSIPKDVDDTEETEVTMYAEAECVIMDVYANKIVLKYYDAANNKYFGLAQYLIDTTPVTIAANPDLTAKVEISGYTSPITVGSTVQLTATLSDLGTAAISWTSSDTSIATVTNGLVTGVSAGTATITASATGYSSATQSVAVQSADATLSSITATKTTTTYTTGATLATDDITVTATYSDSSTETVTGWTTNASTIDMTTAGTKTLIITYTEDDTTVTCNVTITVSAAVATQTVYYTANHNLTFTAKGQIVQTVNKETMSTAIPSGTHLYAKWDSVVYSGSSIAGDAIGIKSFKLYQGTTEIVFTFGENYKDYSEEVDLGTTTANADSIYYILSSSSSSTATFPVTMNITGFKVYSKG